MTSPEHDPSVDNEPWRLPADAADRTRGGPGPEDLSRPAAARDDDQSLYESVWDEPGHDDALSGPRPAAAPNYASWLSRKTRETNAMKTWMMTAVIAAIAGPAALIGTLLNGSATLVPILAIVILGPVMEEVMKSAAALWVVEKRPFWFSSRLQIAVCALASGFVFAAIENLMYLHVYVEDASESLARWRWSVCVALHMGCSLIASLGLMRIWSKTYELSRRPELTDGAAMLTAAVVIHGTYNGCCVAANLAGFDF